jgi:hypothetical protein
MKLRVTESKPFAGCHVDHDKGVVYGVLLCGSVSENGRDYPWGGKLGADSVARYEGRPVYLNHNADRQIEGRVGVIRNVRAGDDGRPRGDFKVFFKHPHGGHVLEMAEHDPTGCGFSHVADCRTTTGVDGRLTVEAVDSVESIDLVCDPATTKGFFESVTPRKTRSGTAVKTTLKKMLESLSPKLPLKALLKLKRLGEMDGMGDVQVDAPDDGGAADPDDAVDAAFGSAMHAQLDAFLDGTLDAAAMLKKLKALMKAHGDVTDDPADDAPVGGDDGPAEEGKKRKAGAAIYEAIDACRAAGFVGYTTEDLEIVAATPAANRSGVARRLMASTGSGGGEKPKSQSRSSVTESVAPAAAETDLAKHW